jgi:hypothetical protein
MRVATRESERINSIDPIRNHPRLPAVMAATISINDNIGTVKPRMIAIVTPTFLKNCLRNALDRMISTIMKKGSSGVMSVIP